MIYQDWADLVSVIVGLAAALVVVILNRRARHAIGQALFVAVFPNIVTVIAAEAICGGVLWIVAYQKQQVITNPFLGPAVGLVIYLGAVVICTLLLPPSKHSTRPGSSRS